MCGGNNRRHNNQTHSKTGMLFSSGADVCGARLTVDLCYQQQHVSAVTTTLHTHSCNSCDHRFECSDTPPPALLFIVCAASILQL